jgi:hypothetical protein
MTGRQHDAPAGKAAPILKRQFESPGSAVEPYDLRIMNLTDRLPPKPVGIL